MKTGRQISRTLLRLLVATMYVVTSSTAVVHGLSHLERLGSDRVSARIDAPAAPGDAPGDCFFCFHGPAIAMIAAPAALPAPAPAHNSVDTMGSVSPTAAAPQLTPPLRAPPVRS
jgi:hypothetical protein